MHSLSRHVHPVLVLFLVFFVLPGTFYMARAERDERRVPFVYYLQRLDKNVLIEINPEVAVVDPNDSHLTKEDIEELRKNYSQTLYAYLSVGEVDPARQDPEDTYAYQKAWDKAPWITQVKKKQSQNKMWGSRRVEYWDDAWQQILLTRIRHAIELGYDGVMLDTVDSYGVLAQQYKTRDLKQDMANLVGRLRDQARERNPAFKILVNGAMELYDTTYQKTGESYLSVIDGQLKEDTWYNEKGEIKADWTKFDLEFIKRAVEAGKKVYSIDYFTNEKVTKPSQKNMQDYFSKSRALGMIPFAADRSLGEFLPENRHIPK